MVDSYTMQYLSAVMRMFDILEQNITKVENIEKMRDPQPTMETIYLLCSTSQNIDRIIGDLAPPAGTPPHYEAAHVFFVDGTCTTLTQPYRTTLSRSSRSRKQPRGSNSSWSCLLACGVRESRRTYTSH